MFIRFANPEYLILIVGWAGLLWWYSRSHGPTIATIRFSSLSTIHELPVQSRFSPRRLLFGLRMLALLLLILGFARPQSGIRGEEVLTEGIDIVLAIDISSSMLAEDIRPNRVEATKIVAKEFIQGRKNDRIGLVVFAGEAYTQCPLTLDYSILLSFLDEIRVGMIEDGTAIGMGIATAVKRLKSSEAKSKIIILLSDGQNNRGEIDPITAAQTAQAFEIKIYTICAGTRGTALYPVEDPFFGKRYVPMKVDVDEELMQRIAQMTGGRYYRATDRRSLESIYREIDRLEKTEIKVKEYTRYNEWFSYFVFAGFVLVLAEVVLGHTRFRTLP